MLHELLFALSGYPGSIFVKHADDRIEIVSELPFISPSEVELLSRLCQTASYHFYFCTFIRTHGHSPFKATGLHGLYLKALCEGLDKVLDPYRQTLLDLEQKLIADPHLTAAYVQKCLHKYEMVFPVIKHVLEEIVQFKAHGCYILEILHRSAVNGIPEVKQALKRMIHDCHVVMYKHLSTWMLHGILLDRHNEFFIRQVANQNQQLMEANSAIQNDDDDDDLDIGGVTGRQLERLMLTYDSAPVSSVSDQFTIQAEKLPSYIPTRVAQNILFVGESVLMFQSDVHVHDARHGQKASILAGKEDEFAREIEKLSELEEFDVMAFETTINDIKCYVAEKLWQLIVKEADLPASLQIMKDFYLLGRGELFLTFIDKAHDLLQPVPTTTTEHDINMAFQHAARNVLFEDESVLQRFHLTVDDKNQPKSKHRPQQQQQRRGSEDSGTHPVVTSGWNLLRLKYKVERPLHTLFTPSVIDRYNQLFQFLLRVKRVQLELQQFWALQMQHKHLGRIPVTSESHWWLHNHMIFLIDHLQYYLQADVIESQFTLLLDKIQNTPDFEEIRLAHDAFLTSLLSQSFLLVEPISKCLGEILEICHRFCLLMTQADMPLSKQQKQLLEDITQQFQRQSGLLFKYLSGVRGQQAGPHLAQLLLRVDYNKYFSFAGNQLGK